jgi:hypothetical protein
LKNNAQIIFIDFVLIIFFNTAKSQNPLPDFSVEDLGKNKTRISWNNQYGEACIQLTVQASLDSVRDTKQFSQLNRLNFL